MTGRQEDGGVGVIDIESKFKALAAAWCRILIDKTLIINKRVKVKDIIDIIYVLNVSETNSSNFTDCKKKNIGMNKLSDINAN